MANLKEVKNRISSVNSTQQITKAMKMVAAAKLRRAQNSMLQMRPYANKLGGILQNVSNGLEEESNEYREERDIEKVLIVAITSDRGLCGPFNSNVFKSTTSLIADKYTQQSQSGNITILPIGRRSRDYFKKQGFNMVDDFSEMFTGLSFAKARKAAEYAMNGFLNGNYDKVEIVYNEFKNVATQVVRQEPFLPIVQNENTESGEFNNDYIFLPNQKKLIEDLIPNSLKVQFYKAILESNASEHGARMTAMDKATENAGDLLKELKLKYNQTRQAAITTEILEIVAGAEALG